MQNDTAFYYSLEKALDMLENDARSNIAKDEYKESRIYAFTDGLDQASVDDAPGRRIRMRGFPERETLFSYVGRVGRWGAAGCFGDG